MAYDLNIMCIIACLLLGGNFDRSNMIEQKDMTFDHDFCYSFPIFSSLLKKEGRRKGE